MTPGRKLANSLLSLCPRDQISVGKSMGSLAEDHVPRQEDMVCVRLLIIVSARDQGKLNLLWDEIQKLHDQPNPNNPYAAQSEVYNE